MSAPCVTFAEALDVIDMQLLSPLSPEVVLPRDHAQLLAALLTDMLRPGTKMPQKATQRRPTSPVARTPTQTLKEPS